MVESTAASYAGDGLDTPASSIVPPAQASDVVEAVASSIVPPPAPEPADGGLSPIVITTVDTGAARQAFLRRSPSASAPSPADDAVVTDAKPVDDAVKAEPVEPTKSKRKRRTKSAPGKKVPHRKPRAVAAAKKIAEPTKTAPPEFADYSEVPTYDGITWYPSADNGCEGRTYGADGTWVIIPTIEDDRYFAAYHPHGAMNLEGRKEIGTLPTIEEAQAACEADRTGVLA
jgi:hypothetical protein